MDSRIPIGPVRVGPKRKGGKTLAPAWLALLAVLVAPVLARAQARGDDPLLERQFGYGRHSPPLEWDWGELFYGREYRSQLLVSNECDEPRPVHVYVGSGVAPYLTVERRPMVPARTEDHPIPITITTPDPPDVTTTGPALPLSLATLYVDIAHRPYNWVVLDHRASHWSCQSDPKVMGVSGHIHVDPAPGDASGACLVAWNTGVVPPGLDIDSCASDFRAYARHYRETVIGRWIEEDPESWAWFPTPERIDTMEAASLLEAKRRADRQRGAQTAGEADP